MTFLASNVEIPFLTEIIVVLGLSILVIYLFQRLNLPAILGFLATGILFGPHALGLVSAGEEIKVLSEIGVVLLLFIIGLEFSIKPFSCTIFKTMAVLLRENKKPRNTALFNGKPIR